LRGFLFFIVEVGVRFPVCMTQSGRESLRERSYLKALQEIEGLFVFYN